MPYSYRPLLRVALTLGGGVLLISWPVSAEPTTWAVLVGVDNYLRGGVTKLNYAGADAKLLAQTLKEKVGVLDKNVFLYTTDNTDETQRPLLSNIVYRLDWLKNNSGPDDTIIFYFAGHGISKDGETYLLTQEADPRAAATLKITSLSGSLVYENLGQSKARNSLVLLDACRNDPTAGRGDSANPLNEQFSRSLVYSQPAGNTPTPSPASSGRNLATIFACSVGERSWESSEKKHGYFTYFLVEALTKSAGADGKVTLQSTTNYLQKEVKETTFRHEPAAQSPMLRYEGPGPDQWVLTSYNSKVLMGSAPVVPAVLEMRLEAEKAKAEIERAKREAAEASVKVAEQKVRVAEEKAATAEAKRYELETQNKHLEKRAALLELENKAGATLSAAQEQMKAELDKARLALQQTTAALGEAEARAQAAQKKKDEAELRASQAVQAGNTKVAETARAEALESEKTLLAEKAKTEQARRMQVEAENLELQKRLALLSQGNEAGKAELDKARLALQQTNTALRDSEARAEAAQKKKDEAELRAAQAVQAGNTKVAETARAEALESEKTLLAEKARTEQARRLQVEAENQELQKRMALLEVKQSQGNEAAKAELDKAKLELQKTTAALLDSEARAEAAQKKKDEAERRAAQLAQTGNAKDAEKARAEALQSAAALLAEKVKTTEARRLQVEAENQELQKRLAMLEVKQSEQLKGNEVAEKLQKEVEQARDEVRIARQLTQASEARAAAAKMAVAEAETRRQSAEMQAQAMQAKINEKSATPDAQKEIARLQAEADRYKMLLAESQQQRQVADVGALRAESNLMQSEQEFAEKYKGRAFGKRPTRKGSLLKDLLHIDEEQEELPLVVPPAK